MVVIFLKVGNVKTHNSDANKGHQMAIKRFLLLCGELSGSPAEKAHRILE